MGIVDVATIRGEVVKPDEHIFLGDKAKWLSIADDGAERWDYFDDGFIKKRDEWTSKGAKIREDMREADDEAMS